MSYEGVCIELSVDCPHCGKPIAINRVAESVLCDGCRKVLDLPPPFWQSVMGSEITRSLSLAEGEGQTSTMIGCTIGATVQMLYGHHAPRCGNPECRRDFTEEELRAGIENVGTGFECPKCGTVASMRVPPEWFQQVHPLACLLVGEVETGDRATRLEGSEGIPFHCYHCGGSLPLDPERRKAACTYCGNEVTVPDDIWVRLNPVSEKKRWFVLLDVGRSHGILPGETDSFCAIASAPDGELIGMYHAEDAGEAGHPCRLIRADAGGLLRWIQDGVEFDGNASLLLSPGDGCVCIFDDSDHFLRFVDSATGEPVCTVKSAPDDEDESGMYLDYCQIACDIDGTILHHRDGRDLRRFDRRGTRLPLWPAKNPESAHPRGLFGGLFKAAAGMAEPTTPTFENLQSRPSRLPADVKIRMGWDGRLYVLSADTDRLAVLDHDGTLAVNTAIDTGGVIDELHDFGADREGRVYLLFEHARPFRDTTYPHLGRIMPGGAFEVWVGPRSKAGGFIGEYCTYLAVAPDGSCLVAYDFEDMRRVSSGGDVVWRSPGTAQNEESQLEDLEENRKGKRQARDRE